MSSHQKVVSNHTSPSQGFRFGRAGESPFANLFGTFSVVGSPGWLNPSNQYQQDHRQIASINTLKSPVLGPLLPYIESIISTSLACDLLELYSTSSSTCHVHPVSPHVLGYIFRKESFLTPVRPKTCRSSMLLVAAQTSDSPFLTSPPSARGRVCQRLLEITVSLLRPLVHSLAAVENVANIVSDTGVNVVIGGLGVAMTGGDQLTADDGAFGCLDNIPTYIHLAVIVSASEYKAASMRWWNAAWTLTRELRLGRELPENPIDNANLHGQELNADGIVDPSLPD